MNFAVLFAATLPSLVLLLVVLAVVDRASRRQKGGSTLSAAGLDVFSAAVLPGRDVEQAYRAEAKERRVGPTDGAPPHGVDLGGGTAHLSV